MLLSDIDNVNVPCVQNTNAPYPDNFYAWYNGRRYLLAVAMGGTRYI